MQLLEFMRRFNGDLAANPSPPEAERAYQALTAYITRRQKESEAAIQRSISPALGSLIEDLYLDVNGMLTTLQVLTPPVAAASWRYANIRVPEGEHVYIADHERSVVRRIDRPDEEDYLLDAAMSVAGPVRALAVLVRAKQAGKLDQEFGFNNQPVDPAEIAGLLAFCDRGVPITNDASPW